MAAADYAEGKGEPPPEMKLAFSCQYWKCLPYDGGYFDQPAGMMSRMAAVMNVYNAVQGFAHAKNAAEWAKDNPEMPEIIQWIEQLRENKNG